MKPRDEQTLCTSWTLVARLKNLGDQEAWREFYGLYGRLVLGVALKSGLQREEAEEVVQETMSSVSGHIEEFQADPDRGSFRAWLLQMARWRIQDQVAKRLPRSNGRHGPDAGTRTATVERVPDPRVVDLDALCDAEWRERLTEEAFKKLQFEVSAQQYQIFHLLVVERKPAAEVARMLGRNVAQIYLTKHRTGRRLQRIVRQLEARLG